MKILLAGDSWGCGVWRYKPLVVIHKGIEQFMLDDGHEVTNVSEGNASNNQIYDKLNLLPSLNFDYIFYIQTDPIRSIIKNNLDILKTKWFEDYQSLLTLNYELMKDCYKKLNELNKTIYIMGGCSKVNTSLLEPFTNLKLVLSSIPEFLEPKFVCPEIYNSVWFETLDDKWDIETLDKLIEQKENWFWLQKNSPHFKDDPAHPDRHGYEKVYNYIKENILK